MIIMKINAETYSIKEISELTGFQPHVIRFYEKEFQLKIPRDSGNRRYFTYKELEELLYIKNLQERGLTNPQIRQVLKSPKVVLEGKSKKEVAVTGSNKVMTNSEAMNEAWIREAIEYLKMEVIDSLSRVDNKKQIEELSVKIDELKLQLNNQEKDVLICENAKLKMKLKEKSYEVAELKDKIRRENAQKKSIFKSIFGAK
ncbi:MerR family transcriptional regulator [Alkaliphilus serpentinus]|uniref:MerR family transcriptional regulator n=2 Tax=Alkaliphilus serpentinus TaxID=1482731 RepID=A0A833HL38_9FIRM|nr:MerR family transcriptional regulator [Alkaliphilus serpentinus]